MRTIRFSFLSTNRVCLTLWGDPFGGDGVPGDIENLWNISKTHEPLCEQQCDQFCTKPDLRMCPVAMALLHDNAGLFSYGDAVYPPLRDAHFPDVMGRLPLASWFRWWRGMESMEKHGKLWGCMGRFIRLGQSLAEPGKKDNGAAQGAILVGCWSCLAGNQHVQIQQIWIHWINPNFLRASSIRGQPTALPLLLPWQKKTTGEPSAHSKPLITDSSIPFACHAKENIVFIRAVARLFQIPGLAFLQCT